MFVEYIIDINGGEILYSKWFEREERCRTCSDNEHVVIMEKVVVHRPRSKKEVYYKCNECGKTFRKGNLKVPYKAR